MDLFSAIETRTSCRQFLPDAVEPRKPSRQISWPQGIQGTLAAECPALAVHRHHGHPRKKQAIHAEAEPLQGMGH